MSKAEKLLIAAGLLTSEGRNEFSAEDLVVRAHKEFRHDFSMKGYPDYPDSNVVFTQVMGKSAPLIVRGWLEKTGTKQYRLTPKGLDEFNGLERGDNASVTVRLGHRLEDDLARLLISAAYELFKSGQQDDITFHQFCRFCGLSARDKWQKVLGKLQSLEHLVKEATKLGEAGEGASIWLSGHNKKFSPEDLRLLEPLYRFVTARFQREMEEWRRNVNG